MSVTRFHHKCDSGITLSENNTTAAGTGGWGGGTVCSSVPLHQLHNNRFVFKIKNVRGYSPPIWEIGVTRSDPGDMEEIPRHAGEVPQTWCVCPGTGQRYENSRQVATGRVAEVTQQVGDVWCVEVTPGGQVYIYHNYNQPWGSPVFTLPPDTTLVWAVVTLYKSVISVVQEPDIVYPDHPKHGIDMRTPDYSYVVRRASSHLEVTMIVEDVVKYLYAADILTKGDIYDMENLKRAKKSNRLIEILAGKGKHGLNALRKALEETGQGHLNEYLPHPLIPTEDTITPKFERPMFSDTEEGKSEGIGDKLRNFLPYPLITTDSEFDDLKGEDVVREVKRKGIGDKLRNFWRLLRTGRDVSSGEITPPYASRRTPDPVSSSLSQKQSQMSHDKDQSPNLRSRKNCPTCGQNLSALEDLEPQGKPITVHDFTCEKKRAEAARMDSSSTPSFLLTADMTPKTGTSKTPHADTIRASLRAEQDDTTHALFSETREAASQTSSSEKAVLSAGEIEPQTSPPRINKPPRHVKFKLILEADQLSEDVKANVLRLIAESLHYKCRKDGQPRKTGAGERNPLWNILVEVTKSVTEGMGLDLQMRCESKDDIIYLAMLYITGDLHKILVQSFMSEIRSQLPGDESESIKFKTEVFADDFKSYLYNLP